MKPNINENEHPDWDDYRDGTLSLKKAHAFEAYLDADTEARQRYDKETEMLGGLNLTHCDQDFATSEREFVSRVMATLEIDQKPSVLAKINRYLMPFAAAAAIALVVIVGQSGFLEPQEVTDAREMPIGTCISAAIGPTAELPDFFGSLLSDTQKVTKGKKLIKLFNKKAEKIDVNFDKAFTF